MSKLYTSKKFRILGKISWGAIISITFLLIITTFIEYNHGTKFTQTHIYNSLWFVILWTIAAVCAGIYIFIKKTRLSTPALCLHLALLLILAGAFVTHCFSQTGTIHLRKDIKNQIFTDENRIPKQLPFQIELTSFEVIYYPGTDTPADYVSHFIIYDTTQIQPIGGKVSMNHIFTYQGYRFYQTSFDSDGKGSIFSLNQDIWGIPITYSGYFLLFISSIFMLLDKKGTFRKLLKHPVFKERKADDI